MFLLYYGVKIKGTYSVFEGVFRGDAVDFLNGVGGYIKPWWLTVINHQHLVVFLIGCKNERRCINAHISSHTQYVVSEKDTFLSIMFYLISIKDFY